jgi:hypothetical protein
MTAKLGSAPVVGASSVRFCVVLVLALTCWTGWASPLNSDAIRARYGSYSVVVISQSTTQRVAALRSGFASDSICRTLALTQFAVPVAAELLPAHQRILAGASIGETIRNAGFVVTKSDPIYFQLSSWELFEQLAQHTVPRNAPLLAQIYRIGATTAEKHIPYAVIIEIYHPDYRSLEEQETIGNDAIDALDPTYRVALDSLNTLRRENP